MLRLSACSPKLPLVGSRRPSPPTRPFRTTCGGDERAEEGLDYYLTSLLEQRNLDPHRKAAVEALLQRHETDGADNPPLSILFGRYYAENKLQAKTKLE
jgi:hypothetical protein